MHEPETDEPREAQRRRMIRQFLRLRGFIGWPGFLLPAVVWALHDFRVLNSIMATSCPGLPLRRGVVGACLSSADDTNAQDLVDADREECKFTA